MDKRLTTNKILTESEKDLLLKSEYALLIHGFANTPEEINKLDECIIGIIGDTPEKVVAVYSYERLAIVFWFIQCGGDPEMDLEEWDSISCNDDPSGLFDAEDDISTNYLLTTRRGSPVIASENFEGARFVEANEEGGDKSGTFLFRGSYLPILSIEANPSGVWGPMCKKCRGEGENCPGCDGIGIIPFERWDSMTDEERDEFGV